MDRSVLHAPGIPSRKPVSLAFAGAMALLAVIWTATDIKPVVAGEYRIAAQSGFASVNGEFAKNDDNDSAKITGKKKKKKKKRTKRTRRGSFY